MAKPPAIAHLKAFSPRGLAVTGAEQGAAHAHTAASRSGRGRRRLYSREWRGSMRHRRAPCCGIASAAVDEAVTADHRQPVALDVELVLSMRARHFAAELRPARRAMRMPARGGRHDGDLAAGRR